MKKWRLVQTIQFIDTVIERGTVVEEIDELTHDEREGLYRLERRRRAEDPNARFVPVRYADCTRFVQVGVDVVAGDSHVRVASRRR